VDIIREDFIKFMLFSIRCFHDYWHYAEIYELKS